MQSNDRHKVYKSLETDEEFVARVRAKHPWWAPFGAVGVVLDDAVWWSFQMQRKLVERTT